MAGKECIWTGTIDASAIKQRPRRIPRKLKKAMRKRLIMEIDSLVGRKKYKLVFTKKHGFMVSLNVR